MTGHKAATFSFFSIPRWCKNVEIEVIKRGTNEVGIDIDAARSNKRIGCFITSRILSILYDFHALWNKVPDVAVPETD